MSYAGLDLGHKRLDVCVLSGHGDLIEQFAVPPDADGLKGLMRRVVPGGEAARGDRVDYGRTTRWSGSVRTC